MEEIVASGARIDASEIPIPKYRKGFPRAVPTAIGKWSRPANCPRASRIGRKLQSRARKTLRFIVTSTCSPAKLITVSGNNRDERASRSASE